MRVEDVRKEEEEEDEGGITEQIIFLFIGEGNDERFWIREGLIV